MESLHAPDRSRRIRHEVVNLLAYGAGFNLVWELGQAGPLYGMWGEVGLARGLMHVGLATLGDAGMVAMLARLATGGRGWLPGTSGQWARLLGLGLVAGTVCEIIARSLGWWTYTEAMPTLPVPGPDAGWAPILQMTALPALSAYFSRRWPLVDS